MDEHEQQAQRVAEIDTFVRHRIKFIRSRQGRTQSDIAAALGIVPQQYHKYESGVLRLSSGMVAQIADALECSILELVPEELRRDKSLEPAVRLDALKQEVTELILDTTREDVLVAIKVLLGRR